MSRQERPGTDAPPEGAAPRSEAAAPDAATLVGKLSDYAVAAPDAKTMALVLPPEVLRRAQALANSKSTLVSSYHTRALSGEPAVETVRTMISGFFRRRPSAQDAGARVERLLKEIGQLPLLREVDAATQRRAIEEEELDLVQVGRDRLIEAEGRVLFVLEGQLSLGIFRPAHLLEEQQVQADYVPGDRASENREFQRRQKDGPLARLAERNLVHVQAGECLDLQALHAAVSARMPRERMCGVFSLTPAKVLCIGKGSLDAWVAERPALAARARQGLERVQSVLQGGGGARGELTNFFVRNGMSIATRLRVVDLDRCTFCRECEAACAERYGVARLNVEGKVLGAYGFADTCRTCADQRCVQVCAYDAIRYSEQKREVLINEELCTGCSLCSLACPYDAIQMHVIERTPTLAMLMAQRIERQRAARGEKGDFRPPPNRFRVANKCDHCVDYGGQQACISACTKGALLELTPAQVFAEQPERLSRVAMPAYAPEERDARHSELFDPLRLRGETAAPRSRRRPLRWLWLASLIFLALLGVELALRHLAPGASLAAQYLSAVGEMSAEGAAAYIRKKPFVAGDPLPLALGIIGTLLMVGAGLYSAAVRLPRAGSAGPAPPTGARALLGGLDFHVWAGLMGPVLVLLHTAGQTRSLHHVASSALWLMVGTVAAGLAARFFASGTYSLASQAALEAAEVTEQLTRLRQEHSGVSEADRIYDQIRAHYERVMPRAASTWVGDRQRRGGGDKVPMNQSLRALRALVLDELGRPLRRKRLELELSVIRDPAVRRRVARLLSRRIFLKRQELLLPALKPIFGVLRLLHIPAAALLALATLLHIFLPGH